jgi:hypothetical protein
MNSTQLLGNHLHVTTISYLYKLRKYTSYEGLKDGELNKGIP